MATTRQLAAIMFTDIVGYTDLMGRDEPEALKLLHRNREIQKPLIEKFGGKWLKEMGDGVLSSFPTATEAVNCAASIQKTAKEQEIQLRIGIHVGEVVFEDEDVFGDGVNVASRIQELAGPGEILVSESVYKNIRNQPDIVTKFLREEKLKNVEGPVRIYRVDAGVEKTHSDTRGSESVEAQASKWATRNRRKVMIGAMAIALVGIAGWYFKFGVPFASTVQYPLGDSRIAILPFENNTNDPNLEVFGDMAADWVIQGLMSFDDIKVVSFETVQDHLALASVGNLGSFATRTGADKIVRGSYYLQGNDVIVHSQLIDVRSGEIELALPEIRGSKDNVEAIVEELRDRLLTLFIAGEEFNFELIRRKPPRYDAYEYYLKGVEIFSLDYDESRKMMAMAITLDSGYFLPNSWIIAAYMNEGNIHKADSVLKLANSQANNLSKYDRLWLDFSQAMVLGNMQDRYEATGKIFEKDPRQFLANYHMGLFAGRLNRPKEAVQHFSILNPANIHYRTQFDSWWNRAYAYNLIRLERYDEAIEILGYVPSEFTSNGRYNTLLTAYVLNGDDDLLAPMLKKMENENFSWEDITNKYIYITRAYLLAKDQEKHKEWAKKSLERIEGAREEPSLILKAAAYYFAGDYQKAIDLYKTSSITDPLTWMRQARMGSGYARLGMEEKAKGIITELEETIAPETEGNHKYGMAMIYTVLGEKDMAVDLLKEGFDAGRGFSWYRYDLDPEFLPLHAYPPFEEFVRPKE